MTRIVIAALLLSAISMRADEVAPRAETPAPAAPQSAQPAPVAPTPSPTPSATTGAQLFHVSMVVASAKGTDTSAADLPKGVAKAIADLRDFLPYKRYHLVDSGLLRCRFNASCELELDGPGDRPYLLKMAFNSVGAQRFNVWAFEVTRDNSPPETVKGQARATSRVISTAFSIDNGETIVVGSSKVAGTGDALMFLLTAIPRSK